LSGALVAEVKSMTRSCLRFLLVMLVLGACDHDVAGPFVPKTGSFAIDGDPGVLSSQGGVLVMSRQVAANQYAVEARGPNGDLMWRYTFNPGEIAGRAAIGADGTIYVPVSSGLTSLSPTGALRWHRDLTGLLNMSVGSLAVGIDGRVYTSTIAYSNVPAKYYALNSGTGDIVWSISSTRNAGDCLLEQQSATVYFVSAGGATAVNTSTGAVRWTFFRNAFEWGNAALGPDGTLYVTENADFSRRINAISPDGTLKWSYGLAPDPGGIGPLVDGDGNIYVSSGSSTASYPGRGLVSLSPSGTLNWSYDLLDNVAQEGAVDANKTVYLSGRSAPGQEVGLVAIRDGKVVSTDVGGGVPFIDQYGRVIYAKGSRVYYFMSGGFDSKAWSESGRTPDRASSLTG
jgi:hypothetical protein